MQPNRIRQLWSENKPAVNGWLSTGSGFVAEIMAEQGYDTLTIDTQHGLMGHAECVSMLIALRNSGVCPLVRVPWLDPAPVMRALDAGALGIICPMINTRAEAEQFVGAMKYPPDGIRSFGPTRAIIAHGPGYYAAANDDVVGFAMIETEEAFANVDEIAATPGLDALYVGPSDLASSLGQGRLPPGVDREEQDMIDAIRRILDAAKKHGLRAGIFCGSPEYAARAVEWGFDMVTVQNDTRLLATAAEKSVTKTRALIAGDD